jgi:hypothetical protein
MNQNIIKLKERVVKSPIKIKTKIEELEKDVDIERDNV